ncbi:hypothetical protein [Phycicoccus sp.]|uniref:hypothetical protein n=1 Tax=Phycicoccus sp. TaxID=1902410 RepID=UPI002C9D5A2D|nr:hypothetical protein [Phycicoccus sp.]HMM94535.1 hypothetical protein [Phycicoccus sp.]
MPLSTFEKALPWSGAVAGILFVAQEVTAPFGESVTDPHLTATIADAVGRGYAAGFASLLGALMLLFFSAAARSAQRIGEGSESSYSSVAHAGLVGAGVGLAVQGCLQVALTSAAQDRQDAAARTLMYLSFHSWLVVLVGLVAAFWGIGLGGLRNATLPTWFSVATIVLGVIGVLGPAGALVQLVLPLWLIAASVLVARRRRGAGLSL